jgi:hypothetical protein
MYELNKKQKQFIIESLDWENARETETKDFIRFFSYIQKEYLSFDEMDYTIYLDDENGEPKELERISKKFYNEIKKIKGEK